jgi:hypothetical protein
LEKCCSRGFGPITQTLVEDDARKLEIVAARHDLVTAGHLGIRKTCELVACDFVWPGMRRYIADYVASCSGAPDC